MQCYGSGRRVECTRYEAAECIQDDFPGETKADRLAEARDYLDDEETYSGILIGSGDRLVRFWHPTFQEALAGRQLADDDDAREEQLFVLNKLYREDWRETILLMAGELCEDGATRIGKFLRKMLAHLHPGSPLGERAKVVGLIGLILRDLKAHDYEFKDGEYEANLHECLKIFDADAVSSIDFTTRLEAAEALGQAGDPRLQQDNWVPVHGGRFWMGAQKKRGPNYDPEARHDEGPVREVEVGGFQMGRFQVTVMEYAEFLNHGGYERKELWAAGGFEERPDKPENWSRQLAHPNWPVTGVNWYEASAYCTWTACRLPSEAEWEYAARHERESAIYPWGNEPLDATRANYLEGGPGSPTPVGLYPAGASFDGIQDMVGNVGEWTASDYCKDVKTIRGGAWGYTSWLLRLGCRLDFRPEVRGGGLGFRCVREAPGHRQS